MGSIHEIKNYKKSCNTANSTKVQFKLATHTMQNNAGLQIRGTFIIVLYGNVLYTHIVLGPGLDVDIAAGQRHVADLVRHGEQAGAEQQQQEEEINHRLYSLSTANHGV